MFTILIFVEISPEKESFPTFFAYQRTVNCYFWFYRNVGLINQKKLLLKLFN